MSKWASSVISPTLSSGIAEPQHAGTGHRIIAADQQGQRMGRGALRHGVADERRRLLDAETVELDVASVDDRVCELAAGLDIVAADPPKRLAQQLRREVAAARSDRPGRERRADQPDRRIAHCRPRPAPKGSANRSSFDRSNAPRLRRKCMWDRLLVDCNIATLEERPGNPLGLIENGAIAIADGKILRVGKRTELAGFPREEGRSRSAAPGSRRA